MDGQISDTLTRIASDDLTVTVSDLGAEMQSLVKGGQEYLWQGDADWWSGRSPILFPIVGRAPGDRVTVDGQGGEMKQHGFARRMTFDRVKAEPARVIHMLTDSVGTHGSYPKPFALTVTHALSGPVLNVSATVANTGRAPLPFGLGFHPAFQWPLPGAAGRDHTITLANRGEPPLARLADGFLTETRRPSPFRKGKLTLDAALFDEDAMIFPEGAGRALTYAAEGGPSLSFDFDGLPNVALWQKPGAPFICIEPWHGMAARQGAGSEIADRPGTMILGPGETARFRWSVTLG